MSEVIADLDYRVVDEDGREYFVNVAGELNRHGRWDAWLEFVPLDDSEPLLTGVETHQTTRQDLVHWATTLSDTYLEGAFHRARAATEPVTRAHATAPFPPVATVTTPPEIDPFALLAQGGRSVLRTRLLPLTRADLLTLIDAWGLNPAGRSLARLSNLQLVTFIIIAAEVQAGQR